MYALFDSRSKLNNRQFITCSKGLSCWSRHRSLSRMGSNRPDGQRRRWRMRQSSRRLGPCIREVWNEGRGKGVGEASTLQSVHYSSDERQHCFSRSGNNEESKVEGNGNNQCHSQPPHQSFPQTVTKTVRVRILKNNELNCNTSIKNSYD